MASGAVATLFALGVGAGCGGGGSSANAHVVLRGEYDATDTGEFLSVNFLDDTTYTLKRAHACGGSHFCVEHGTYTVDQANGVITLTDADTHAATQVPYSVLSSAPLSQPDMVRLHVLGGVGLTSGADASLTTAGDAALTQDGAALTQEAGTLVIQINIALTITFGGQSVTLSVGADNGDAGGNVADGGPLGFDGGADLDSGDNGQNEPDAAQLVAGDGGPLVDDDADTDGGEGSVDAGVQDAAADGASSSGSGSASGSSSGSGSGNGSTSSSSNASSGASSKAASGGSAGGTGSSSVATNGSNGNVTGGSDAGNADAGLCGSGNVNEQASNEAWSSYSPAKAISYADAQWNNGVGLCAQFTSAAVTAGGVAMSYTWVPDIVTFLSGVSYDEYSPSNTNVTAQAGDIVVYSNATGDQFCQTHNTNSRNCGHVGLVVTPGGPSTATADFHNSAHKHLVIKYILEGTTVSPTASVYSTFRIYHTAALANSCSGANSGG